MLAHLVAASALCMGEVRTDRMNEAPTLPYRTVQLWAASGLGGNPPTSLGTSEGTTAT